MKTLNPAILTIFGGTGDLAARKLYPALYELYKKDFLDERFAVIGTARRTWDDDYLRKVVLDSIQATDQKNAQKFASHFYYQSHDVTDTQNYDELKNLIETLEQRYDTQGNRLFYLSVSPRLFGTIAHQLKAQKLDSPTGCTRLVIEKPFGNDYKSSFALNQEIMRNSKEEQIYRVDHYLEKEWVQALIPLRFANPIIERLWNSSAIEYITIMLDETIGVGSRGAYYDETGALRDMFQNHILQIVSLLLMDPPQALTEDAISQAKTEAIMNLKDITTENITEQMVRGQYTNRYSESSANSYLKEKEVALHSQTETFVAGALYSTMKKWQGMPVYFRTGKCLDQKATRIDVFFKASDSTLYPQEKSKNHLAILIDPEQQMTLQLNGKEVGYTLDATTMELFSDKTVKAAGDYEKVLYHAFNGDRTHFVHWEELAASWKFVDQIISSWQQAKLPLHYYAAGTTGPQAAETLLATAGHSWPHSKK